MERQRDRDQAGVTAAESQLQQMRTSIQWQRETLENDIALRQAEIRSAQAHLDELLAGSRPQEIQQARAAVADVKAQHDDAQRDWERAQELFKRDDISKAQYDQFHMREQSTAAALHQAEERLAIVVEGPSKEEIESARAQVAPAPSAASRSRDHLRDLRTRGAPPDPKPHPCLPPRDS